MRLGVIARAEDRGLGIQTWETCRALNPDRVLLIDPGRTKHPQHVHRFDRWPVTVARWDGGRLDEPTVRGWLDGLDAVYTAETFYDQRLPNWAAAAGSAAVCHVNPEFFSPSYLGIPEATWWVPTPWRLDHLAKGTQVMTMPVAADRFDPQPRHGKVRILHVAGHPAMLDRNGTQTVAQAAARMSSDCELVISSQNPKHNIQRSTRTTIRRGSTANYWDLYSDFDILVMPRRYGGLCLPAQEAMAAGLAVVMTDIEPNGHWPGPRVPAAVTGTAHTPGGTLDVHEADPVALADTLDRLVNNRDELDHHKAMSRAWARDNSWDALAPRWRQELSAAHPNGVTSDAKVSVLVPYTPDCPERVAAWSWVASRYAKHHPDWEIVTGSCEGPWVKALAVDDAAQKATGDIFVIADADVWCDGTSQVVDAVRRGARWGAPHDKVHRLTPEATADVLAGATPGGPTEDKPYRGRLGGGVVVLTRHLWETAPMDPRFVGWGQEDDAFALALRRVAGDGCRLGHDLWHLWHPPQPRMVHGVGSPEGLALYRRYTRKQLIDTAIAQAREEVARERDRRASLHRASASA